MNKEFLNKVAWRAHYRLKEGTSTSFVYAPYLRIESITDKKGKAAATARLINEMKAAGRVMLLPFRICFVKADAAPVANSGRGARTKVAQMKAKFTKGEDSPYKIAAPFKVCTSIWRVSETRCFYYGTIGITQKVNVHPKDNGDLVIFHTANWKEVEVFIFKGLAKPNEDASLADALEYVEGCVIQG
ncbi:MAG: hypothetical protein IJ151_00875 [Bacteroidales bacterium]|nr:hypothetical protein [Bacteroidales bacterium]